MNYDTSFINRISHNNKNTTDKVIKEGSQVLVRILKDLGNNKFKGTVAGARVTIHSNKAFKSGEVFKANITYKNGIPKLIPQKSENINNSFTITKLPQIENSNQILEIVQNQNLSQYISQMGMIPDNLSNVILLQMKTLGLKFNAELMNKIHDIAAKYPGKEKLAVELMMNFLQKGIDFDPKVLDDLLDDSEDDFISDESDYQISKKQIDFFSNNLIKNFFLQLLKDEDNENIGILSVANTLGAKKDINGFGSWFLFPFEIVEKNKKISEGIFRLLLSNEKKLIKFCIEHNEETKKQLFVLNFSAGKCTSIQVNQTNDEVEFEKEQLLQKIKNKLSEKKLLIDVIWDSKDRLENNTFGMEEFYMIDGEV